ncbi:Enterochelin esterase [Bifidobacterium bohemicum]|uniref:Peptidase n=1 Tax=Bifidobacterium bohemicum DSM 22767 TaxID=1437606 RepID=A0A086ZJ71_9BIFI|nr:alpha/beta hydrolase-fold protein [Bifidobacterium bohemicum]KFI46571.1 peptidase [Bifidobacterium bohemicum DSM 22767]SCB75499.1 Enterochelin esterase [Bifidobacterium bohemicum]
MKRRKVTVAACAVMAIVAIVIGVCWAANSFSKGDDPGASGSSAPASRLETVSYDITYQGRHYAKTASVYVPSSYRKGTPMNILYLLHGSWTNGPKLAVQMQTYLDGCLSDKPMLVVFPTYYPDASFVVADWPKDYALNRFFATDEIESLMRVVESRFTTYSDGVTQADFINSRTHRAFGGYSMGGLTTWEMLAAKPQYFHDFMPMAEYSWINQSTGGTTDHDTAENLLAGLRARHYGSGDVTVIAMVGEKDDTKTRMIPQIDALRADSGGIMNKRNLVYWENPGGGHGRASFKAEVKHGLPYLFAKQ